MSRCGKSRNRTEQLVRCRSATERALRAFRGHFPPVYHICHCYLSTFSIFLYLLRAFLLFNIKASRIEEEKEKEMTKQIYGWKQPPESPEARFGLIDSAPAAGLQ